MAHALSPFPARSDQAHKGDVGRIVVVGGRSDDTIMVGAPVLAANAALRTGAGLVRIVTPPDAVGPIAVLSPCSTISVLKPGDEDRLAAIAAEFRADVVAIGPGLSPRIMGAHLLLLCEAFDGVVVIDADGLNALAAAERCPAFAPGRVILTPHTGELKRLLQGLGITSSVNDRAAAAEALASETRAIVVHKGAGTVVTDGARRYVNSTGNSGMATAGAGDVLTGVISALAGQGCDAFDAASLGAYLHGSAGDLAAERLGPISVRATDIVEYLPAAITLYRSGGGSNDGVR